MKQTKILYIYNTIANYKQYKYIIYIKWKWKWVLQEWRKQKRLSELLNYNEWINEYGMKKYPIFLFYVIYYKIYRISHNI